MSAAARLLSAVWCGHVTPDRPLLSSHTAAASSPTRTQKSPCGSCFKPIIAVTLQSPAQQAGRASGTMKLLLMQKGPLQNSFLLSSYVFPRGSFLTWL